MGTGHFLVREPVSFRRRLCHRAIAGRTLEQPHAGRGDPVREADCYG